MIAKLLIILTILRKGHHERSKIEIVGFSKADVGQICERILLQG